MFTPGRYVVVDDNPDELKLLVNALHRIGAPCVAHLYKADAPPADGFLRGVRVLFLDLHLVPGIQMGDHQAAFNNIVQLLEGGIEPASGPYIIVLWSSYANQRAELERRIAERLTPGKRPLALLVLDKKEYDLADDGGGGADKLATAVSDAVAKDPRLFALISWERDVLAAASATLTQIGDLIPPDDRTPTRYGEKLDGVLSVLASAAVGKNHVEKDVRGAVNNALLPILSDKIMKQPADVHSASIWKAAVTKYKEESPLTDGESGVINAALHVALPEAEAIRPTDWGAVVLMPEDALSDEAIQQRFGLESKTQLFLQTCPVKRKNARKNCTPILLRIGASCDFAQNKSGPIPYVFGLLVAADEPLIDEARRQSAEEYSPVLVLPGTEKPLRIFINARFQVSLVPNQVAAWESICRLREQLLMTFATHCAEYVTRPGIVFVQTHKPAGEAAD